MYPKPLSEKSLKKMYEEAGISERKSQLLHQMMQAAVNLYGFIEVGHLWKIYKFYKELKEVDNHPQLQRKDFINISSIVRREDLPYYMFEQDEVFPDEKRNDLNRLLIHRSLILSLDMEGFDLFYSFLEDVHDVPHWLPEDFIEFLSYSNEKNNITEQERDIESFLENLQATKSKVEVYGKYSPIKHKGKRLNQFDFLTYEEVEEYVYISGEGGYTNGDERALKIFLEDKEGPESKKIMRTLKYALRMGIDYPGVTVKLISDELYQAGVQLTRKQSETLVEKIMTVYNLTHIWVNRGWRPIDMDEWTTEDFRFTRGTEYEPEKHEINVYDEPDIEEVIRQKEQEIEELKKQIAALKNS